MSVILYGVDNRIAIDPEGKTTGFQSAGDVTIPINFADGTEHTIVNRTVAGGSLGNYGFCIAQVRGALSYTAGATVSVSASDGITTKNVSHTLNAADWYFEVEYVLQNRGAENDQVRSWLQDYGRNVGVNESNRSGVVDTTDTSADWTLMLSLQVSTAVTTARVDSVRVQTFFLP